MPFSSFPKLAGWLGQLRSPLVLNGYALVLGAGITAVLGVVYWVVAARLYPEEVVGLNSAAISAMFFLANLAQLNLIHALNRFVPAAGRGTARFILTAYLLGAGLSAVAAAVFLLGVRVWAPSLSGLSSSPQLAVWFVLATASWCVFTLQDGALAGLRQAKWVPLSSTLYALIKLALIALLATSVPQNGVFLSWTAPVLLLVVPISVLIFKRLVPRHVAGSEGATLEGRVQLRGVVRFVAGDYLSSLVWVATINLLPLLVVERLGASSGAHFYLSWTVAYALYFMSLNMGMSLVTEGARELHNLGRYSFETLVQTLRLVVPAVVLIVIAAPYILGFYGSAYVSESTAVLRLLCLSAIPHVVVSIRVSMARVQGQIGIIFAIYSTLCVLVLGLSHVLIGVHGVTGVGFAWLIGQSVVMVAVLINLRRVWWPYLSARPPEEPRAGGAPPLG